MSCTSCHHQIQSILEECYDECTAHLRGACDCKGCKEHIIRNANLLLKQGWIVHWAANGAGGYGFDVNTPLELVNLIKEREEDDPSYKFFDGSWTAVTEELSPAQIEDMVKRVVPSAWVGHCTHDQLVADWRRWFHLLPPREPVTFAVESQDGGEDMGDVVGVPASRRTCFICGKQLGDSWSEGVVFHQPGCGHKHNGHYEGAPDDEELIYLCPLNDSDDEEGSCVEAFGNSVTCAPVWMQTTAESPSKKLKTLNHH